MFLAVVTTAVFVIVVDIVTVVATCQSLATNVLHKVYPYYW